MRKLMENSVIFGTRGSSEKRVADIGASGSGGTRRSSVKGRAIGKTGRGLVLTLSLTLAPSAVRADTIYCWNGAGGAIDRISAAGAVNTFVSGNLALGGGGIAVDAGGNVYAANGFVPLTGGGASSFSGTISEFTPSGAMSTFLLPGAFSGATGLAFDSAGNLYVADSGYGQIEKITPDATVSVVAIGLYNPSALAFDANGNLYSADWDAVVKITPAGAVSTLAPLGNGEGLFGVACDASGNVYASDGIASVYKITPNGIVSIFATGFSYPGALVFDSAGNLLVADSGNNVIERVAPDGAVGTFAIGLSAPWYLAIQTPEPSSLALLTLASFPLLTRRRRR